MFKFAFHPLGNHMIKHVRPTEENNTKPNRDVTLTMMALSLYRWFVWTSVGLSMCQLEIE